jgi:glycosyltransferase involved in cell wall biosynthesis
MLTLARELPNVGVAARLWRPWEDPLTEASCLHLFGTAEEFRPVVEMARQLHIPVVLSPLAWLPEAGQSADPSGRRPLARKMAAWAGHLGQSVYPRWPSPHRQLYQSVDLVLPHSNAEAQQIIRQFRVPGERIRVVPHGADPRLALADPGPFAQRVGERDFVLYVGPIEPRNGQLGFLLAMRDENLPIVFLGGAVAGCEWYEAACRRAAGVPGEAGCRVHFAGQIAPGDALRASAYAACGCLVVASGVEAPERIALEGGMSGAPLVLFQDSPADEYFGHQAIYVKPDDLRAVRRGVLAALGRKRSASLAEHIRTYFSWNAMAKITREAYGRVLRK